MRSLLLPLLLAALPALAGDPVVNWLVLGPLPVAEGETPDVETQRAFFRDDQLDPEIRPEAGQGFPWGAARLVWTPAEADGSGRVDLDARFGEVDFAAAWAAAELVTDRDRDVLLGIGSDDAVRVWLNGREVHRHWGGRSLRVNEDVIRVTLREGANTLLLKVQDREYGWGFAVQRLQREDLDEVLAMAAGHGDLDRVENLLALGGNPEAVSGPGLTAWQFARMRGRREVCALLADRGVDTTRAFPAPEEMAVWWMEREMDPDAPGAAFLVARHGEVLLEGAFGMADAAEGRPLTPNSSFRIGSVTKPFTATAILMLYEAGAFPLDQTIDRWYPDVEGAERITIRHLLTHTSGLPGYTERPDFEERVTAYIDPAALEAEIATFEPDFEPGSAWAYSNSGYFLLARIVQKVSGSGLEAFLMEHLFGENDMVRTGVYDNRQRIRRPDEALGHAWKGEGFARALDWEMSWAGGAGALYSTVGDLFRFGEAWFGGRILESPTMTTALTPVRTGTEDADAFGEGYGYGWLLGGYRGRRTVGHSGGLHGFSSQFTRYPELGLTVVVLCNALPGHGPGPQDIATTLAEIYAWRELGQQESFRDAGPREDLPLEDYVGRYGYPGGAVLTVRAEEGRLYGQLSGQPEYELYPGDPDAFFWKVVPASIAFVRDADGMVTGALHRQNGRELEVGRLAEQAVAEVSPEALDRLAGTYDLRGMDLVVERRGDRLWALLPGQPDVQLFPRSDTVFFLKVVQAELTFTLDDAGRASSVELHQAGVRMDAPRKAP